MGTNSRRELTAQAVAIDGYAELGLWPRLLAWLRQVWCGLHGHDPLLNFERDRMFLRCTSCGHQTPGWNIGVQRPQLVFRGEARRDRLATRPQIANIRRIA